MKSSQTANNTHSVGCVIMASGEGKRFGSNKLMADFGGKPLISNILDITGNMFADRIVVTRHADIADYCTAFDIPVLLHDLPDRNDTVRLGLSKLLCGNPCLSGCLFAVADQPLLTRESLEQVLITFSQLNDADAIVPLSFNGTVGNPVLFGSTYFDELLNLPAKKGGGTVMKQHPHRVTPAYAKSACELMDIDTQEDFDKLNKLITYKHFK